MPKLSPSQVPAYRLHKQSGQGIVTLSGRDILLGAFGSPESREKYNRVVGEWQSNGRTLPAPPAAVTITMLVSDYWKHCQTHYAGSAGELDANKSALRLFRKLYGDTPAAASGPLALKTARDEMVRLGWCRSYVNAQTKRIRRAFRWGVENEMVPASVWQAMQAVAGLRAGKTAARESEPVKPAPNAIVESVLPFLCRRVRAMIELQLHTGMRPGEVVIMRTCDVDTSGPVWIYRPEHHKTGYRGGAREVLLNRAAREMLSPFLRPDLTAYLFSPAEAEAERRDAGAAARKTPAGYGNCAGTNRVKRPRRRAGARYTRNSYRRAIEYGCERAFPLPDKLARAKRLIGRWRRTRKRQKLPKALTAAVPQISKWRAEHRWHPNQLRHTFGTEVRKRFGLEAAQVLLGHEHADVTQVYAETNREEAMRVVAQMG
jgi:integrase